MWQILRTGLPITLALLLAACGGGREDDAPMKSRSPVVEPVALWSHRPEARTWTATALQALDNHGSVLVATVPEDIDAYCPAYADAGPAARKAFWVTFLSALAKHESTWRPDAAGGGGLWHGLLQIAPATARGYGCQAQNASALHNGALNLSCGIRIMAVTVPRDGVISKGMRGVAADWGPFHQAAKRTDIQEITREQSVCQG